MSAPRTVPFFFGEGLLGCYHPPAGAARDCGLVLCQPHGHEYLQFHRAFRQLAVLLTEAGFPVLRFDFHGCGDSTGDHTGWRLHRWRDDVQAAIVELEQRAGVSRIGLVGMRMGGALATLVGASRGDLDALVLWDPVLDGKAHLEELRARHASMLSYAHVTPGEDGALGEILGFPLPKPLVVDLTDLDLTTLVRRPARRVLLIESHEDVDQEPLRNVLASLETSVQLQRLPDPRLWEWNEDFGRINVPRKTIEAVVAWLSGEPS